MMCERERERERERESTPSFGSSTFTAVMLGSGAISGCVCVQVKKYKLLL